jgi:Na+-driven multidrug efflux pump
MAKLINSLKIGVILFVVLFFLFFFINPHIVQKGKNSDGVCKECAPDFSKVVGFSMIFVSIMIGIYSILSAQNKDRIDNFFNKILHIITPNKSPS